MGQVYLAQHQCIARHVAIKVLLFELSSNERVIECFFTEAQATSLIRHPGIVEVLDCDMLEGQAYIVMEYLEGESLAGYLARLGGKLDDAPFALAIVGQVARAVGAAHATGIVHRDLKPDNVFLSANRRDARVVPKVLDFGIAKVALDGVSSQTRTGTVIGTPAYMSPEQCKGGKAVDGRSDIYSLGCILYEALCGRAPFVREGMGEMIVAHVAEAPDDPRKLAPDLPAGLCALVLRMLAKSPDDRPASMDALSSEIGQWLEALGVRASLADIEPRRPVTCPPLEAGNGPISLRGSVPGRTPPPSHPGTPAPSYPGTPAPSHPGTPVASSSAPTPYAGVGGTQVLAGGQDPERGSGERPRSHPTTFGSTVGESTPRPATSRRWALPAVGVVAAGALAVVLKLLAGSPADRAPRAPEPAQAVAPSGAAPAAGAAAPAPAPPPAVPEHISVDLRGLPRGAEIVVDGAATSELPFKVKRDHQRHVIVVRAAGYTERTLQLDADHDTVVDLPLTPTTPDEPAASGARARAGGHAAAAHPTAPASRGSSRGKGTGAEHKRSDNNAERAGYDDM